jgi:hypothetical protein
MNSDTPASSLPPSEATPPGLSAIAAELLGRMVAARDPDQQRYTPPPWLWQGYLGPGKITLLTSQWKSGKPTLVARLFARMKEGGQLAGLPVAAGKALVISEESDIEWRARFEQLGIRDHVDRLCRPFVGQPSMDQWLALLEAVAALHQRDGIALVVIDSLTHFLPAHSENSAAALLECLAPLQRLAAAGISVLLVHHPRKGRTLAGQAARGSGALPAFVDILIEMDYYTHPDDIDRRRRLVAYSRHDDTPRHLLIELLPDGTDYLLLQRGAEAAFGDSWQGVLAVLNDAHAKLTRPEILERWPDHYDRPDATTLWRWLTRAVAQGVVRQQGTGRSRDPFRYWLPAREELIRPDGATREELQAWNDRCTAEIVASWTNEAQAATPREASSSQPAVAGVAASSAAASPLPAPAPVPENADSLSAPLAPQPPEPAETVVPEAPRAPQAEVRLPYPFSVMDPADVPEEVWRQARATKRNT